MPAFILTGHWKWQHLPWQDENGSIYRQNENDSIYSDRTRMTAFTLTRQKWQYLHWQDKTTAVTNAKLRQCWQLKLWLHSSLKDKNVSFHQDKTRYSPGQDMVLSIHMVMTRLSAFAQSRPGCKHSHGHDNVVSIHTIKTILPAFMSIT